LEPKIAIPFLMRVSKYSYLIIQLVLIKLKKFFLGLAKVQKLFYDIIILYRFWKCSLLNFIYIKIELRVYRVIVVIIGFSV